jgi:hypothetical protein
MGDRKGKKVIYMIIKQINPKQNHRRGKNRKIATCRAGRQKEHDIVA